MERLKLLYLSYNLLTEIPANLPPNVIELRFHENKINKIQKDAFKGLRKLHVLGKTWFSFFVLVSNDQYTRRSEGGVMNQLLHCSLWFEW